MSVLMYNYIEYKKKHSCDRWEYGLNDMKIEPSTEENNYCVIKKPDVCWLNLLDGLWNVQGNAKCENQIQTNDILFERGYNKSAKYLGIPSTKYWYYKDRHFEQLQSNIIQRLKSYQTYEEASQYHDVVMKTNFDNNQKMPEYIINVQRNETLIEERKQNADKWQEKYGPLLAKNIIVFYSDGVGRKQFERKLPKIAKWFSTHRKTYQFFRFHTCNGLTKQNLWQLNFGCYPSDKKKSELNQHVYNPNNDTRYKSFFKDYKDAGYIIGHANSVCYERMGVQKYDEMKNFGHEPADHDAHGFACDPNYYVANNPFGFKKGGNSLFRRCLYGKDYTQYVIDYGLDFLEKYKNERKIMWIETDEAHEITMERLRFQDKPGSEFFQNLEKKQLIDDETIVIFLADHGHHIMLLYKFILNLEQYHQELGLPVLLINVSEKLAAKFQKVEANQQKYFTMHNLYHFFKTLINPDYELKDKGLLGEMPVTDQDNALNYPVAIKSVFAESVCLPRQSRK